MTSMSRIFCVRCLGENQVLLPHTSIQGFLCPMSRCEAETSRTHVSLAESHQKSMKRRVCQGVVDKDRFHCRLRRSLLAKGADMRRKPSTL